MQYNRPEEHPSTHGTYGDFCDGLPSGAVTVTTSMHNVVLIDEVFLWDLPERFSSSKDECEEAFKAVLNSVKSVIHVEPSVYTLRAKQGYAMENTKEFDKPNIKTLLTLTREGV